MTVGTQAAVLAGLDITMFIEFNPPHNDDWVRKDEEDVAENGIRFFLTLFLPWTGRRDEIASTDHQMHLLHYDFSRFLFQYDCRVSHYRLECLGGGNGPPRSRWKYDDSDGWSVRGTQDSLFDFWHWSGMYRL